MFNIITRIVIIMRKPECLLISQDETSIDDE